jgi:hypothetical protein
MAQQRSSGRTSPWLAVTLGAVAVLVLIGPIVLHLGQKRHNQLPLDLDAAFPANRPAVPGEVYATTMIALVEHELDSLTGWRPNDFILWGPGLWADNNSNRQLGIIQAVRESMRVFKDHLTKVSSDDFDRNLVAADTAFRNDAEKFWLPSAESKFREGVKHLRAYLAGLKTTPQTSKPINQRNVEAMRLFQAWTDLLGAAHGSLYRPAQGFFTTDDDFYRAQGFAHVLYHLNRAIEREYRAELEARPVLKTLMHEANAALGNAAVLKPLVIFDGSPASALANHRRNLDAYINEARQKMYSIREELEK